MKGLFKVIKHSYLWLGLATVLVVGALSVFFGNVQYSEEFTGGVSIIVDGELDSQLIQNIEDNLQSKGYEKTNVLFSIENGDTDIKIHTKFEDDAEVTLLSDDLTQFLVQENIISDNSDIISKTVTGPSVGTYMKNSAIQALIAGIIFMVIYMLFSFAGIRQYLSPSILSLVTVVTMIFDIAIPAGAYGIWMSINPTIQIDTVFIIAILTCMGYSINDTIIIFDRIRENFQKENKSDGSKNSNLVYGKIFEDSIWQTMRRSMATSISTLLVVIAMFIFGTGIIQTFAFTIGIGIIAGSYSSIFIAAPLAYLMSGRLKKENSKL